VIFTVPDKHGFIEIKYIKEWPKKESTKVKLPLRPEQKSWIATRGEIGGNIWVFCRIHQSHYLLDWKQAITACDGWTCEEWSRLSEGVWGQKLNVEEFLDILVGG
jgi:hypothetical protein